MHVHIQNLEWRPSSGPFCLRIPFFNLKTGEKISIVGPSGAGKSTLLGLLSLALRPSNIGHFSLTSPEENTYDIGQLWSSQKLSTLTALRSNLIGFVPQTSALLPFLNTEENILLPAKIINNSSVKNFTYLIEKLGLQNCLKQRPDTLSVGQRQRVAVARALLLSPPLILADEPTASVPPEQAAIIYSMLLSAPKSTVVMVTHDRDTAKKAGFMLVEARTQQQETIISHTA